MLLLAIGLLLFTGVHLIPALAPGLRETWRGRMGEAGYKGVFSLLLLLGVGLIVAGWRSTQPAVVYMLPTATHHAAMGLLVVAFLFLVVSTRKSRLRRWIRHPQLTGVALWGIAHLLLNGDSRSLLLFGGLTLWALVEIIAINRREGVWIKDPVPGWGTEVVTLLITAVVIGVVISVHPWIAGMPVH
jgi:uncharacterized membrane protein